MRIDGAIIEFRPENRTKKVRATRLDQRPARMLRIGIAASAVSVVGVTAVKLTGW